LFFNFIFISHFYLVLKVLFVFCVKKEKRFSSHSNDVLDDDDDEEEEGENDDPDADTDDSDEEEEEQTSAADELPPEEISEEETGGPREVRAAETNAREIGKGTGEKKEENQSERTEVYAENETINDFGRRTPASADEGRGVVRARKCPRVIRDGLVVEEEEEEERRNGF